MVESQVSRILLYTLYTAFVVGVAITLSLPFAMDSYMRIFNDGFAALEGYRNFIQVFLLVAGGSGLWVIFEMIGMLRSIPYGPFVSQNVRALQRVGYLLLILSLLFVVKCFCYMTFLTLVCTILLIMSSLFAFTLADLFRRAVAFREENDLTI